MTDSPSVSLAWESRYATREARSVSVSFHCPARASLVTPPVPAPDALPQQGPPHALHAPMRHGRRSLGCAGEGVSASRRLGRLDGWRSRRRQGVRLGVSESRRRGSRRGPRDPPRLIRDSWPRPAETHGRDPHDGRLMAETPMSLGWAGGLGWTARAGTCGGQAGGPPGRLVRGPGRSAVWAEPAWPPRGGRANNVSDSGPARAKAAFPTPCKPPFLQPRLPHAGQAGSFGPPCGERTWPSMRRAHLGVRGASAPGRACGERTWACTTVR